MATVQQIIGGRVVKGVLGIEIETESATPYEYPRIPGWKSVSDGSLRDFGREYITEGAVDRVNLGDSLKAWKNGMGAAHGLLRPNSISTSVHVHVNVQDHTPLQALNFYLCGILFENVMARFAGPDRVGNLFCLRTVDAEDQYNAIKRGVKNANNEIDLVQTFNPNGYKYSNINTVPITNFGSIEFRVMRGTIDIDEIKVWAEVLHDIRQFAKDFDNPVSIVRAMKDLQADGLLSKVFGDNAQHFKYPNWERDLLRNFIYVADMATCRKAWDIKEYVPSSEPVLKTKRVAMPNPGAGLDWVNIAGVAAARRPEPVPMAAPVAQGVNWDEDFEEEDI